MKEVTGKSVLGRRFSIQAQNILFDLDGTLVNSLPGIEYALREAIQMIVPEREGDLGSLAHLIGPPVRQVFNLSLPGLDGLTLNQLEKAFRRCYDSVGWAKTVAYPSVLVTIDGLLRYGIQTVVVTNKPAKPTTQILARLGLAERLVGVVSPDLIVPTFESKVEMVAFALVKHRFDPTQTIMVGDSSDDALAAQGNDVRFIAASYGYGYSKITSDPTLVGISEYILTSFSQLLEILVVN